MEIVVPLVSGLVSGYVTATLSESLLHRCVGHASPRMRRAWRRLPLLGGMLKSVHFGHSVIHHHRTYALNHVTQFRDVEDRHCLDERLSATRQDWVRRVRYGLLTDLFGAGCYVVLPAIACAAVGIVPRLIWSFWYWFAAVVPLVLTPMLSRLVHPHLHQPLETAVKDAGPIVRWLLNTDYGLWLRQTHFVHHCDPTRNFNLLPGGDYLLGTYRLPNARECEEMRSLGLLECAPTGGSTP